MESQPMSAYDSTTLQNVVTDGRTDLESRDVRALTEYHSVLPEGGDIYTVVSQSESTYTVDICEGRCTCPDWQHHVGPKGKCKHIRRVEYATGNRPIPAWINTDAVDPQIGVHVSETPVVAVTDGGTTAVSEPIDDTSNGSDNTTADGQRPDDCQCDTFELDGNLPCFSCYVAGFDTRAPTDD
mgnify:CR=1 FL=1